MKQRMTFWNLLGKWFIVVLVLGSINMFMIESSLLHNILLASLGVILLLYPVWPEELEQKYSEEKCKLFIRIIAVLEIVISFSIKTTF